MKKLTEIKFYVGTEIDMYSNRLSEPEIRHGFELAREAILKVFDGYTITEAVGVYKSGHPEKTTVYTVLTENGGLRYTAHSIANRLADCFHQNEVLFTVSTIEGDMVRGS